MDKNEENVLDQCKSLESFLKSKGYEDPHVLFGHKDFYIITKCAKNCFVNDQIVKDLQEAGFYFVQNVLVMNGIGPDASTFIQEFSNSERGMLSVGLRNVTDEQARMGEPYRPSDHEDRQNYPEPPVLEDPHTLREATLRGCAEFWDKWLS